MCRLVVAAREELHHPRWPTLMLCHADASATAQYECRQCISSDNFHPPPEAQAYIVIAGQEVITSSKGAVMSTRFIYVGF